MKQHYAWKPGSRIRIDAEKAGRELTRMEGESGGLTPEKVLDRARSANSALHAHFEWDDTAAAHQHRLQQARELIRSITVETVRTNVGDPRPVRAFVSVTENEEGSYASTARAMSDKELRAQVLARAWRDLQAWRQRYAELVEFSKLFEIIDRAQLGDKGAETG